MWRDAAWLLDMLNASRRVQRYVHGLTEADFLQRELEQDAVVRQLTIIGEAAKRISTDFRAAHPDVPWKRVAGFRDVVVHDYLRVDLKEVWRITQEDVPALVALLEPLVPPEGQEPG